MHRPLHWFHGGGGLAIAKLFDGVDEKITVPLDLSLTNVITISFHLWWDAFANDDRVAMEFGTAAMVGGFQLNMNYFAVNQLFFNMTGNLGNSSMRFDRPTAAAWHHYFVVLNKGAALNEVETVLVDGAVPTGIVRSDSLNTDGFANSTLYIMHRGAGALWGAGRMAELAIWATTISTDHVPALRDGMPPPAIDSASLKLWLPLSSPTASQAENLAPTGSNGTVTGATVTEHPPLGSPLSVPTMVVRSGGQLLVQSVGGSTAASGVLAKQDSRALAGSSAGAAVVGRGARRFSGGSAAAGGAAQRAASYTRAGSVPAAAAAMLVPGRLGGGSASGSGAASRSTAVARFGTAAPAGAAVAMTGISRGGATAPAGSAQVVTALIRGGAAGAVGDLRRASERGAVGSATLTGAVARSFVVARAGLSTLSSVVRAHVERSLAGSSPSSAGVVTTRVSRTFLAGSSSAGGALRRLAAGTRGAAVTASASVIPSTARSSVGQITGSGSAVRSTSVAASGSVAPVGSVVPMAARVLQSALSLVADVRAYVTAHLEGQSSPAGVFFTERGGFFGGSVVPLGGLARRAERSTGGEADLGGDLDTGSRSIALGGSSAGEGGVHRAVASTAGGQSGLSGQASQMPIRSLVASLGPAAELVRRAARQLDGVSVVAGQAARSAAVRLTGAVAATGVTVRLRIWGSLRNLWLVVGTPLTRWAASALRDRWAAASALVRWLGREPTVETEAGEVVDAWEAGTPGSRWVAGEVTDDNWRSGTIDPNP